ncbi:MAG: DUF3473 domain-containing protein [candidate division Zixibacteria bacterium]|nr:DUF3473 domain-containing protein [candidate division Zixibacteria bacterium]
MSAEEYKNPDTVSMASEIDGILNTSESKIKNIFTADVEDYFHVSAFSDVIKYSDWGKYKSRIIPNILSLLGLLEKYKIRGTFFILGWVAEKFPEIVTLIHQAGHEIACHSYLHRLVYKLTPRQFYDDTKKAKDIIEEIINRPIHGYRAPSFSIVKKCQWAWDMLDQLGFTYSSSVYPIKHDRYGFLGIPRTAFQVRVKSGSYMKEIPMTTISMLGKNIPVGGGGYLRLFPLWFTRMAIRRLNHEGIPAIVYMHPWEMDPHQPKMPGKLLSRFRHYTNLSTTEYKLGSLFGEMEFTAMNDYIESMPEENFKVHKTGERS